MWHVIITIIVGGLIMAVTIRLMLKTRRKRILANRIPGPVGLFMVGNLSLFTQEPELFVKNLTNVYRMYEKSLFKIWLFDRLLIVLTRPEDIEKVLKNPKCLKKSTEYSVFQEFTGIFSNNNLDEWKHNRKLVIKGLGLAKLKSLIPIFYQEAKVLTEILQEKCDLKSNDCDISQPVSMATMEIIGKTTLGVTFNAQRNGRNELVEAIHKILYISQYRIFNPWFINNTIFYFSSVKRDYDRSKKLLTDLIDKIIKSQLAELHHSESSPQVNIDNKNDYEKPKTFIEILVENSNELSLEQMRNEIITIIIAGQDTSAMANACTLFMLAHHQDVQNKVYEELQSIFSMGDYERQPTYEDLQQMNYLDRVIKETLRLYPSAPIFGRSLEEEMEIGGQLCPAGATLIMCPMFLQTSPLYYTDPNKFNPDNFLSDACSSRHPYTYIPFSGGLRNCIGGKYALLQVKTIISTLVRKFKFFPSIRCPKPEYLQVMFPITLRFIDGCYVKIEPRI